MEIKLAADNRPVIVALALISALVLAFSFGPAAAGAASGGEAAKSAAKKKCKKKGKKAVAAAKKKCGKRKSAPVTTPAPVVTPPVPSTLRATLTWDTTADLDLYVWAPGGTESAVFDTPSLIPSTSFSADDLDGLGPETFTDLLSPSSRQFSYGICVSDDDGLDGTIATLTYRRADGSTNTISSAAGNLDDPGDAAKVVPTGPPAGFDPGFGTWC